MSEAQKQVNSVDVGDSGAVEAASSGLAQAAANFQTAYDNLQGKLGGEGAAVEVDADTEAALAKIRAIAEENPTATATMILDSEEVDDYSPKDKSASAKYTVDHSSIDSWTPPEKKGKVTYTATGPGNAKGTRNAVGGETLVDEDGAELIEHRNQGTFELGTNAGARLTELDPGDIVHTASETKSILKRVKGVRFFSGDAFSGGTYKPTQKKDDSGSGKVSKKTSKSSKSSKSNKSKSKSSDSDVFDWIEVLIERVESAIKSLGRTAESTFKTLATRTSAITSEIKKVNSEIKTQQKATQKYFDYADKVAKDSKLSDSLKKKVHDGTLDITKYKGETLDAIKEFQQWYEKGLAAQERAEELQEERSQLYQDRFEMIETDYDNQLGQIEHELSMFEKAVSMSDYTGADKPFKDMIKARQDSIKLLNEEAKALQKQLDKAVASGAVEEGSEAWYEMVAAIAAVKEEAADAAIEVAKLRREAFDDNQPLIKDTKTEASVRTIDLASQIIQYLPEGNADDFIFGGSKPLTYQQIRRMRARIQKDTGFDEAIVPRRFRTTVLTDIYDVTKDIKQAQEAAGHTNASTTLKHYVKGRKQNFNTATPVANRYGLTAE